MPLIENPDMEGYVPPPMLKGTLKFKVLDIRVEEGKSPLLIAECIDEAHPDFLGRKHTEFIPSNLSRIEKDSAREFLRGLLNSFAEAFGVEAAGYDTDDIIGKEFRAIVNIRQDKRDGSPQSSISKYLKA